ncbi:GMC family oxidoreductase [Methanobacterium alkalithermotolerans]|uniref:GMC family oxidoreductase n=1 Tax=Methanobacterium alkalithermotolerans TaxID=2731220 RepID=A0A8T8K4W2_9EURY|nr:FAD-dependent oxidoreductase [Methanobacterium alkalithermotolerans]QUH22515.1 GMC family oxidoreductase [Methanobacterium alkalithermotolerans]
MSQKIVIIGSGAGGATIARELATQGNEVVLLEKGNYYETGQAAGHIINKKVISNSSDADEKALYNKLNGLVEEISPSNYDNTSKSNLEETISNSQNPDSQKLAKEENIDIGDKNTDKNSEDITDNVHRLNIELMYLEGVGGTTSVSLANACYACSTCYADSTTTQFQVHDLELYNEFLDAGKEMHINPLPYDFRGPITQKITETAEDLGFFMEAMPKFIDFSKCINCGNCLADCKPQAKWDSSHFVKDAIESGTELITEFEVTKIIHHGKKVSGVEGIHNGRKVTIKADKVIISAGALNTPLILRNSNIKDGVGEDLFCDLFITVGAYLKDSKFNKEIPMGVKSEFGPYFISPHYSAYLPPLIEEKFKNQGREIEVKPEDVVGFMIKIADESNGFLDEDGNVIKDLTNKDIDLFKEGIKKSSDILFGIGADSNSLVISPIRGAHPGGTASMGKVVDNSLQTSIKGLFVADASVIPRAPGRPPILTIVGLAKKLAKIIAQENSKGVKNSQELEECV